MKLVRILIILGLVGAIAFTQRARLKRWFANQKDGPSIANFDGPAHVTNTLQAAVNLANSEGKTLLYHFSVDNCNPCDLMDAHVFDTAPWKEYAQQNVKIINVHFPNQFTDADQALVRNAQLMDSVCKATGTASAFPIVAVFSSDGHVLAARSGYHREEAADYISWLEELRKRDPHRPAKPVAAATTAKPPPEMTPRPATNTTPAPVVVAKSEPVKPPSPVTNAVSTNAAKAQPNAQIPPESYLTIKGLMGGKNPMAVVSTSFRNYDVAQGDVVNMQTPTGKIRVECKHIGKNEIILLVGEGEKRREIKLTPE